MPSLQQPSRYALGADVPRRGQLASQWRPIPLLWPEVHQWLLPPSSAFLRNVGSPNSLATKHLVDVSTLSGRAISLYPPRYKTAFASSTILTRAPWAGLTVRLPGHSRRGNGVPRVQREKPPGSRRSHPCAGGTTSTLGDVRAPRLGHTPFWSKPDSTFGLLACNDAAVVCITLTI